MIAMLHGALELAQSGSCHCLTKTHVASFHSEFCQYRIISEAITATAETVAAWKAKELEPLRREVAMLRLSAEDRGLIINGLILEHERSLSRKKANSASNSDIMADDCARLIKHFTDLNNTRATAEAYEREVAAKEREACAVICDVAEFNGKGAHYCAVTIRAASNKPKAPHIIGADYAKARDTTAVLCARCLVVLDSKDIKAHVCVSNKEKQE